MFVHVCSSTQVEETFRSAALPVACAGGDFEPDPCSALNRLVAGALRQEQDTVIVPTDGDSMQISLSANMHPQHTLPSTALKKTEQAQNGTNG